MADYDVQLNRDLNLVKTPAEVNSTTSRWQMPSINVMEYYGATVATRPNANAVPVGAVFMAVDSAEIWQSNGASWVVLS